MGRQAPEGLLGIHMYLLVMTQDGVGVSAQSEQERAALAVLAAVRASGLGHFLEKGHPHLTYFNEAGRGGHFAAWEEPELFASEVRAAFESVLTTAQPRFNRDHLVHDLNGGGARALAGRGSGNRLLSGRARAAAEDLLADACDDLLPLRQPFLPRPLAQLSASAGPGVVLARACAEWLAPFPVPSAARETLARGEAAWGR